MYLFQPTVTPGARQIMDPQLNGWLSPSFPFKPDKNGPLKRGTRPSLKATHDWRSAAPLPALSASTCSARSSASRPVSSSVSSSRTWRGARAGGGVGLSLGATSQRVSPALGAQRHDQTNPQVSCLCIKFLLDSGVPNISPEVLPARVHFEQHGHRVSCPNHILHACSP